MRANRGGRFFGEASGLPGPSFLLPSLPAAHYTFSGTPGQKVFYENLTGGAGSNRNFKRQRPRGTSTYESASPDMAQALGMIRRQAEFMGRMVDDLLEVARAATGKVELRRQSVVLQDVARAVRPPLRD